MGVSGSFQHKPIRPGNLREIVLDYNVVANLSEVVMAFKQQENIGSARYVKYDTFEGAISNPSESYTNFQYRMNIKMTDKTQPKIFFEPGIILHTNPLGTSEIRKFAAGLVLKGGDHKITRTFSGSTLEVSVDAALLPSGIYTATFYPA